MKNNRNPYALSFGRVPTSYINRDIIIDKVVGSFTSEFVDSQCYKLTGVSGSGKTVTLTTIVKTLKDDDEWVVVDLSSSTNIVKDMISILSDKYSFVSDYIETELNLSLFGIGVNVSKKPIQSIYVAVEKILEYFQKKNKRLLITIDEISKSEDMISFIKLFQQMIRNDLPIYFLAAGLNGKIEELENTEGLTFFLRASKINMSPLNYTLIRSDYQKKLGVSMDVAEELAFMTRGYAFAYQALGKYMWESDTKNISQDVLEKFDAALAEGTYNIIWRELSENEKMYISFICKKEMMDVSELLELTKKKNSEWTRIRKRLIDKEVITTPGRGIVKMTLPRFDIYISNSDYVFGSEE